MTTRITQNELVRVTVGNLFNNQERVSKYADQVSGGIAVRDPSDSTNAGLIDITRQALDRYDGHSSRLANVESALSFQDNVFSQVQDLLTRAKEIAEQGANETNSWATRAHLAEEVYQIRDHLASLANSTYQGNYIFNGTNDGTPPFTQQTTTDFVVPAATGNNGEVREHWAVDPATAASAARATSKTVNITDDLTLSINSSANVFTNAMNAMEKLGRALSGFKTDGSSPVDATNAATNAAYNQATDYSLQTLDIKAALDGLIAAGNNDIMPERVTIGGKLQRTETAKSLLELNKGSAQESLTKLQDADPVAAASALSQAQTALQASYSVTARLLNLSILDYI